MNMHDYFIVLRRRWLSAVVVCMTVLAVTAALTLTRTPSYTATTRLFFGVQSGQSVSDLAQGSNFTEKQMASYAEVATSPLVLAKVIGKLGLQTSPEQLVERVSSVAPIGTVVLEIAVTDPNAAAAAAIANTIGEELTSTVSSLIPAQPDGTEAVRATTLAPAIPPLQPSSPAILRNLLFGLILGALLGVAVALIRNVLDSKIRSEQDVQAITSRSILGVVPFDSGAPTHPVVMHDDPLGVRSEAVRRLRTNLQFVDVADRRSSIVVTSSIPGEGKSTTAINLAVAMGDAGMRVILVDADLRRPSIAEYLGIEGAVGLTTVLIGRADVADVVQPWQQTSVDILPAGQIPPNPSELLGSKAMEKLLRDLAGDYDMVLLDSPPLLPVTDAAVLSKLTGGALVVVGADRTHRPQLRESLATLEQVEANILGLVLNKISKKESSSYSYYYDGYRSHASTVPEDSSGENPQAVVSATAATPNPNPVELDSSRAAAATPHG